MRHFHYDTIDSTNSQATRLVQMGEIAPFLVTATTQSAGRGRNGRTWQSPPGGAWMSAVWPIASAPESYITFPLIVGLSAWHAIFNTIARSHKIESHRLQIKWPNDILLDDRKVCGVLCETIARDSRITHLVAGVGINVAFPADQLEGELRHPPTSLSDHFKVTRNWVDQLIRAFGREFDTYMRYFDHHGFDHSVMQAIQSRLAYIGQVKTWQFGLEKTSGAIEGIDAKGRLVLSIDGQLQTFDCGELCAADSVLT